MATGQWDCIHVIEVVLIDPEQSKHRFVAQTVFAVSQTIFAWVSTNSSIGVQNSILHKSSSFHVARIASVIYCPATFHMLPLLVATLP